MSANDAQIETITSYSTNVVQRDPQRNEHSMSSVSVQYHITDEPEKNEEYQRMNHGRSDHRRKVFHIKNPFQRQLEHNSERGAENFNSHDSDQGASNQYASMQYSLPPEEFLQQMRAENQYMQQQYSTPAPSISYTVAPQQQYQYNSNSQNAYEGTQASNQIETKVPQAQAYHGNPSNIQYLASPNSYMSDNVQGSPASQASVSSYVSTSIPEQYVGTSSNPQTYVSSASPMYLSSPQNIPQYVSSPITIYQTGSPDYNNRVTTSSNNMNYDNNDSNKKLQIDHYNNGVNGMRYPSNGPQQYQNDVSSTTQAPPSSTPYSELMREAWSNNANANGINTLSKSLQEASLLSQYQNQQNENQQQNIHESSMENMNSETHRISNNVASANNMYMNIVQPDYQTYTSVKSRTRDLEQETGQPELYSHGDYGWKLAGKKSLVDSFGASYSPYNRHHIMSLQGENYGHSSYQPDSQKSQVSFSYNPHRMSADSISQHSKYSSDHYEAQEFAKAAARAHENMKQQQAVRANENYYLNNYAPSYNSAGSNSNLQSQSNVVSTFYGNTDKHKTKYIADNSNNNQYVYGNSQSDLITASPFYYENARENNADSKSKQPFDHAKALKNIVPIDVSNVVSNSESALKAISSLENSNRYNFQNYPKEQIEQSIKQSYRPLTDSYYKDKNSGYGFNIKTKPDEVGPDSIKQLEQNIIYYNKNNPQESSYNQGIFETKRYADNPPHQVNYVSPIPNTYQEHAQPPNNIQQAIQRPLSSQPDIATILKLNDIPYRLTQGLNSDQYKLHNTNFDIASIPQPIPGRINQNMGSHQIDVTNSLLSKLMLNKQAGLTYNRPNEIDPQTGGPLSTIHGFRVANPFNVDLKLVAEMLKGKPMVDESQLVSLRDQYNKQLPLKLDMSTLQQLLIKNDNYGNLAPVNEGLSAIGSSYTDPYGRYPFPGQVKYSRSQEEEESIIPIAESSNTHPIGAVMEQDEMPNSRESDGGAELTVQDDEVLLHNGFDDNQSKFNSHNRDHRLQNGPRHPNSLIPSRNHYPRKFPKHEVSEPYPLLKPPPPHSSRNRIHHSKGERRGRRRRITKPKITRIMKSEPLFESESSIVQSEVETPVPILLRPPPPVVEEKSDDVVDKQSS